MRGFGAAGPAPGGQLFGIVGHSNRSPRWLISEDDGKELSIQASAGRPNSVAKQELGSKEFAGPHDSIANQARLLQNLAHKRDNFANADLPSAEVQAAAKFKRPAGVARGSVVAETNKKLSMMKGLPTIQQKMNQRTEPTVGLAKAAVALQGGRGATTAREARLAERKLKAAAADQEREIHQILEQVDGQGFHDPAFVRFVREVECEVSLLWKDMNVKETDTITEQQLRSKFKSVGIILGSELELKLDSLLFEDEETMDKDRFIEIFVSICLHVQVNPTLSKLTERRHSSVGASWEAARHSHRQSLGLAGASLLGILSKVRAARRASAPGNAATSTAGQSDNATGNAVSAAVGNAVQAFMRRRSYAGNQE
eukprot:TRINITY_DN107130_c0_g1_i1.p1 TRINITY_DN107130_c0_g1~~TRINITY_DN107130_c0_g1_i1.p1  ORF type:complete len:370 (+),score=80.55 TRINITY_DN107130_c0_g1_i1:50-1159(+)